jgi:DNA primase
MKVEQVLEILKIEQVKERNGELICRCPLAHHEHDDTSPAFHVNSETGLWICFKGCGKGTLRRLAARILGDAKKVRQVIREAGGVALGTRVGKQGLAAAMSARASRNADPDVPVRLPAYCRDKVPNWVKQRGLTKETLQRYRLGASVALNALVIPVPDAHALIYRAHPEQVQGPRYRYTRGFKAHSVLYTLFDFEMVDNTIILVEGPLDVLWLRQNGFPNSLGIFGGGTLGVAQREIIEKINPSKIILAFDNDEAGRQTTEKCALRLKRYDCYAVEWSRFPDKKDVAELSPEELVSLLSSPALIQPARLPKLKVR